MTTHRGTIQQTGNTLDEAIRKARVEIAAYVGARRFEIETKSEALLMFGDRPCFWRVDVEWWVVDPVPPVPPNTGKTIGGRR